MQTNFEPTLKSIKLIEEEQNPELHQLQGILLGYLENNPKLSLNGLSKRCSVSEPTLRRIKKGHTKTLPSITTILDLLSYICKESQTTKIIESFPGPLAEHIKYKAQQVEEVRDLEFSEDLTKALKDPTKYVLYKLSANPSGIHLDKAAELFGSYGERQIQVLLNEGLIRCENGVYYAKIKNFALSNEVFVDHFKTLADFIKPHKHANAQRSLSPIFSNFSSSINKEAYSQVLKIQRTAMKKIARILSSQKSEGSIPTFVLNAIDTIDDQCADELAQLD